LLHTLVVPGYEHFAVKPERMRQLVAGLDAAGAKDPKANAALFDYGILANLFHGLLMIPQAFIYPNEHAHLWADVPLAFAVCVILWIRHPNRVAPETRRT
jgi:hypothetical protein